MTEKPSAPRLLYASEIEDIVDSIPVPPSASKEVSRQMHIEIKKHLRLQLKNQKIYPEGIQKLKDVIICSFYKSLIHSGSPIGITTGEAIGQPVTQASLKSFHTTGAASSASSTLNSIRELLNYTKERKVSTTRIHFKNKDYTFEQVLEVSREIVGITINDVMKESKVIESEEKKPDWYDDYKLIFGENGKDSKFIRLYLDKDALYANNLTVFDVYETIYATNESLKYVVSPNSEAIIDIYPEGATKEINKDLKGVTEKNADSIFLQFNTRGHIGHFFIRGVQKIKNILPVRTDVSKIIISEESLIHDDTIEEKIGSFQKITGNSGPSFQKMKDLMVSFSRLKNCVWKVWVDITKIRIYGIPLSKLARLYEVASKETGEKIEIKEVSSDDDYIIVETEGKKPSEILTRFIKRGEKIRNEYEKEKRALASFEKEKGNRWKVYLDRRQCQALAWEKISGSPVGSKTEEEEKDYFLVETDQTIPKEGTEVFPLGNGRWKVKVDPIYAQKMCVAALQDLYKGISEEGRETIEMVNFVPEEGYFLLQTEGKKPFDLIRAYEEKVEKVKNASTYVSAIAEGCDLRKLLAHPLIDSKYTISNNYHNIMEAFGIEAVRNYIVYDFYRLVEESDSYINARFIYLIADFMTNLGTVIPITSKGISRQNRGAFSDATFEQPFNVFVKAATSGRQEDVISTSACIFMGKRCKMGTGSFDLVLDHEVVNALKKQSLESKGKAAVVDEKALLQAVNEIVFDEEEKEEAKPIIRSKGKIPFVYCYSDVLSLPPWVKEVIKNNDQTLTPEEMLEMMGSQPKKKEQKVFKESVADF